ncbi:MAG: hypothetical protein LBI33_03420, partial [Propionibacteriaceae bacterium]|nr:hypothetical protein [Propionibacteriaceae bacterium]
EEVVSFLFRIQVQKAESQPEPQPEAKPRRDVRRAARQALAAEEAAARSEIHLTAEGLLAPVLERTTVVKKAPASKQTVQTATLRESRPGASGRRNQKKR